MVNRTPDLTPEDATTRNTAIERDQLAHWATQPDRAVAYYHEPSADTRAANTRAGLRTERTITTWTGVVLGRITSWRVYRHNFGGRMVSLTARGTNGATYYGRASYDTGTVITLRKHISQKGQ